MACVFSSKVVSKQIASTSIASPRASLGNASTKISFTSPFNPTAKILVLQLNWL